MATACVCLSVTPGAPPPRRGRQGAVGCSSHPRPHRQALRDTRAARLYPCRAHKDRGTQPLAFKTRRQGWRGQWAPAKATRPGSASPRRASASPNGRSCRAPPTAPVGERGTDKGPFRTPTRPRHSLHCALKSWVHAGLHTQPALPRPSLHLCSRAPPPGSLPEVLCARLPSASSSSRPSHCLFNLPAEDMENQKRSTDKL